MIKHFFFKQKTAYEISACLVGSEMCIRDRIKVYQKFASGDPDTSKTAASWFGACIFLIVAATILRSFFL